MSAGRPRLFRNIMRFFSANMTPKHIEIARLIGDGNCSKGVRIALARLSHVGSTWGRWAGYIEGISTFSPAQYSARKTSIRITLSEESRKIAIESANSVSEGIRVALELYGLNDIQTGHVMGILIGSIDADIIKKLDFIQNGLYKKHDC